MSDARLTAKGVELTTTEPEPTGKVDRLVVATNWSGPLILARLHEGEADPTQEDMDAWAAKVPTTSGVPIKVRVIERPPWRTVGGTAGSTPRSR